MLAGLALLLQGLRGRWRVVWIEGGDTLPTHSRAQDSPPASLRQNADVPVFAPSPPAGEGMKASQQVVTGEGVSSQKALLTKTPPHPSGFVEPPSRPLPQGERAQMQAPALADAGGVALVAAALILDVVLMPLLGFIVASAVLFTLVAAAFGSRRLVLDAALGFAFAGAIYLVFVHGLGLHLPVGDLWESMPWRS